MRFLPLLLFLVLCSVSVVGVEIRTGVFLNTTGSESGMTFSVPVNATNVSINSTVVLLENVSCSGLLLPSISWGGVGDRDSSYWCVVVDMPSGSVISNSLLIMGILVLLILGFCIRKKEYAKYAIFLIGLTSIALGLWFLFSVV